MPRQTATQRVNEAVHAALSILCYVNGHEVATIRDVRICRNLCRNVLLKLYTGDDDITDAFNSYPEELHLPTRLREAVLVADEQIPPPPCIHGVSRSTNHNTSALGE